MSESQNVSNLAIGALGESRQLSSSGRLSSLSTDSSRFKPANMSHSLLAKMHFLNLKLIVYSYFNYKHFLLSFLYDSKASIVYEHIRKDATCCCSVLALEYKQKG